MSKKEYTKEELIDLLEELHPKADSSNNNLIIDCPACGERECSISLKKKGHLWGCFRLKKCGEQGNLYQLLKRIGKLKEIFREFRLEDLERIDISSLTLNPQSLKSVEEEIDLNIPDKSPPLGWTRIVENDFYLKSRGFKSYQHCFVGRTSMEPTVRNNYVIFLVHDGGKVKGWVGRHTWDKQRITDYNDDYFLKHGIKNKIKRYSNSPNTAFAKILYGYDDLDENNPVPVCLVEGIFDKHAVDEKLYLKENPFIKTCATFKAEITEEQIIKLKLKNVTDIILFYDPDVIRNIKSNIDKLERFFNVKVIISNNKKDPDELTQEELIETFETRIFHPSIIKTDFIQLKSLKF